MINIYNEIISEFLLNDYSIYAYVDRTFFATKNYAVKLLIIRHDTVEYWLTGSQWLFPRMVKKNVEDEATYKLYE